MKSPRHLIWLMLLSVSLTGCHEKSRNDQNNNKLEKQGSGTDVAIGFYDSRAVAVAFAGTNRHEGQLQPLIETYQQAKSAGDQQKMAAAEQQLELAQQRFHRQGFGIAPVEDILALYSVELPEVLKKYQVERIISKWDEATLQQFPQARLIDVTPGLIDMIGPNERQRKFAIEIQQKPPVSNEELDHMKH
ncbi:MAG: hypothetical protein HJJLKODD_00639 [Phycisphaerae bacterium]|nr:hypothetical protein [Phycisphaerae bacterium]